MILLSQFALAAITYGLVYGVRIPALQWPEKLAMAGLGGVLVYCVSGQLKALTLNISFDAYSWVGMTAVGAVNTGHLVILWRRHHNRRR